MFLSVATLLCLLCVVSGSKILVVFPVPERSHSVLGDSLVKILLNDGHEVTYVSVFPKSAVRSNLTYVDVSSVLAYTSGSSELKRLPESPSAHEALRLGPQYAARVLQHEALRSLMADQAVSFDAVLADWFYSGLLAPLAELYQCPLVWYTAGDVSWQSLRLMHEEPSPTYSVDAQADGLPHLPFTVKQRAYLLWTQFFLALQSYYSTHFVEISAYQSIYSTPFQLRVRPLPNYVSQIYNGSLMLVNSHPPLGQTLPLPQNVKYVGGHHMELPVKPLQKKLQVFLDKAQNGVIYVSLGELPAAVLQHLLQVFERLEQVVLWRMSGALDYVPRNVHVLDQPPQLSILNHPNTMMFISDGSISSLMEATHCGVPLIGIPLKGDQYVNVDLVVARGYGRRVDLTDRLTWDLQKTVAEILGNYSYRMNARQASTTFKQRLLPARSELIHWVRAALTPAARQLRSPALLVSAPERFYLDLLLLLLLLAWFCSKVIKVLKVHMADDVDFDKKDK